MPVLFQLADLTLPQHKGGQQGERNLKDTVPAAQKEPLPEILQETAPSPIQEPAKANVSQPVSVVHEPPRPVLEASPAPASTPSTPVISSDISRAEIKREASPIALPELSTSALEPVVAKEGPAGCSSHEIAKAVSLLQENPAASSLPQEAAASGPSATVVTAAQPSPTDVTPPAEPTAPSPRERGDQRAKPKNRQTVPPGGDWVRTHGKFIAVGFVFALIATIYMARRGDEPAPAHRDATATSAKEHGAEAPGENEAKDLTIQTAKEAISASEHQASPAHDETSPAHANLGVPTGGNTIHEPTEPAEVAEANSLFPWKGAEETRVAAKPESPKREAAPKETKSPVNPGAGAVETVKESRQEESSIYGPPGSGPAEEVQQATGEIPSEKSPAATPENSSGTRDFEMPPSRSPAPEGTRSSSRATPAAYQPASPTNVPPNPQTGPRYERTGSGVYQGVR
jgi:hypothetical protein